MDSPHCSCKLTRAANSAAATSTAARIGPDFEDATAGQPGPPRAEVNASRLWQDETAALAPAPYALPGDQGLLRAWRLWTAGMQVLVMAYSCNPCGESRLQL